MGRTIAWLVLASWLPSSTAVAQQPSVTARKTPILTVDNLTFKDLNKNGVLDKYEDWRLSVEVRVADLVSKMTLGEKAGLMVHSSLQGFTGAAGTVLDTPVRRDPEFRPPANRASPPRVTPLDRPSPRELILQRNIRWVRVRPSAVEASDVTARFSNGMQEIAEGSRLGIPISFSSEPRHSSRRFQSAGSSPPGKANISQWPEQIGFAAIGDPNVVREFGRIAAQEYRALGLQTSLSPIADVATEPRWNRVPGTFGEDAKLARILVKAYIEGFQGKQLGPESVMCVTKHFPGGGAVKDGLDSRDDYGKWLAYPGKHFDYHLIPFQASFESGTGGIMPGYAIPLGVDTVGMTFSKIIVNDLLRGKFGYNGLVVTDWLRSVPWGVEHLTDKERQRLLLEAGVDQIGGDNDPRYIIEMVKEGVVPEKRIDESVRRVLKPLFQLGLFENPYVDPDRARSIVASSQFMQSGEKAQRKSIVLLKNANKLLPLSGNTKVYVENMSKDAAAHYGTVVYDPKNADATIIKVTAPYALRPAGARSAGGAHEGTLAYAGAENAKELEAIRRIASSGTPTIVVMYMDRPAVLSEFIDEVRAVLAHFGSSDNTVLDILFGRHRPGGKLPFNLPRDNASVTKQYPDVPHDLENPLFRFGFGLSYGPETRR